MQKDELKIHSVKYNFIMNMILKMSSFIFPLITFPYVSRVLGAVGIGKVSFATSIIYYFTTIASLGIPTYGIKACAQCRNNKDQLSKLVHELIIISTIMTVVSYISFCILLLVVPKLFESRIVLLVTSSSLVLSSMGLEWFYQAIEQYDYITYRNLAFKVISIVLMFVFVTSSEDYIIYAAVSVLGSVGSNILNLIRLKKYVYFKKYSNYDYVQHIKPIMTFFLLTVATTIYTNVDTVMLGFLTTDEQVGFYNTATKLKGVLLSVVTALGTVMLPRVSYYIQMEMMDKFREMIKKSFQFVLLIAFPLMTYFIVEAGDSIIFLAGEGFQQAVLPMQIIMPTILFIGLSNVTGIQILVPMGKEKYTIISTVYGAVVDLILNAVFITKYGAAGVAFATVIAELVVLVVQIIYLRHELMSVLELKEIAKIISSSLMPLLVIIVAKNVMTINSAFIRLVVTSIIYFGLYAINLIIMKTKIVRELHVR